MASIFDFINGITNKKKTWEEWTEPEQKKFAPFIVNRWLSMRMELTDLVNELQCYTIGQLKPRDTYKLYHDLLPNNKAFAKYIKGKKSDKYDVNLIQQFAEHYQISKSEVTDYLDLMDKESCDRILSLYGYNSAEKKKLLKGIK
jgi:hypothetical protein|tara:strand:+ start:1272 stop:1703 length:432 start_codon:yes stop_codon:yes gene_type:complete